MAEPLLFACDHAGLMLKAPLMAQAQALGWVPLDLGTHGPESVDYPDYGQAAALALAAGRVRLGVIICGSGIGIAIAANRHPAARAAVCNGGLAARLARQHNDANLLALGARLIGIDTACDALREFLTVSFEGGRHSPRVAKLSHPSFSGQDTP